MTSKFAFGSTGQYVGADNEEHEDTAAIETTIRELEGKPRRLPRRWTQSIVATFPKLEPAALGDKHGPVQDVRW
jgi:hypothetical protein